LAIGLASDSIMIHPHTELRFISEEIGFGVVANRLIPKGTITWVMDKLDQVLTPQQVASLGSLYSEVMAKYTFRDNRGNFVLCWDHGRFINHSFNPSCITTAYDFELAVRDIQAGEELTDDYGTLNLSMPFCCLAERGTSRKVVNPDDLIHYHRRWDRKLRGAFRRFCRVGQPLAGFLDPDVREMAVAIARGRAPMDSILTCFYPDSSRTACPPEGTGNVTPPVESLIRDAV
jgi:hypothetical protein